MQKVSFNKQYSHISRQRCKRGDHPQIRAKVQKRAQVKSHGKHLRRSKKVINIEGTMALVKSRGKHPRQSQCAWPRKMGGYSC